MKSNEIRLHLKVEGVSYTAILKHIHVYAKLYREMLMVIIHQAGKLPFQAEKETLIKETLIKFTA